MTPKDLHRNIKLGLPLSEQMLVGLLTFYSTPERFYHNISHVIDVLDHYKHVNKEALWQHPYEVYLAVLYHDAIYEYGAKDNEEKSAQVAAQCIVQYFPDQEIDIDYVKRLIELTAIHGRITIADVSEEEALFLDCDMAIMGASWERFCQYQDDIEKEYTKVYPRVLYRIGRKKFLKTVAQAERIFLSQRFHRQYDAQARSNLKRALSEK